MIRSVLFLFVSVLPTLVSGEPLMGPLPPNAEVPPAVLLPIAPEAPPAPVGWLPVFAPEPIAPPAPVYSPIRVSFAPFPLALMKSSLFGLLLQRSRLINFDSGIPAGNGEGLTSEMKESVEAAAVAAADSVRSTLRGYQGTLGLISAVTPFQLKEIVIQFPADWDSTEVGDYLVDLILNPLCDLLHGEESSRTPMYPLPGVAYVAPPVAGVMRPDDMNPGIGYEKVEQFFGGDLKKEAGARKGCYQRLQGGQCTGLRTPQWALMRSQIRLQFVGLLAEAVNLFKERFNSALGGTDPQFSIVDVEAVLYETLPTFHMQTVP